MLFLTATGVVVQRLVYSIQRLITRGLWLQIAKKDMEKASSNCDFGCVHTKIAKAFAPVAVVLVQLTMPTALSVFLTFECCRAFLYSGYIL